MKKKTSLALSLALTLSPLMAESPTLASNLPFLITAQENTDLEKRIIQDPIRTTEKRKELTRQYCKFHYGIDTWELKEPKAIILHSTHTYTYKPVYHTFYPETLHGRKDIKGSGAVNTGAHFVVDRNGAIYQLAPLNWILRHAIGYNYCALGIENVARDTVGFRELTPKQIEADADLIEHLVQKFPSIIFLFQHKDYAQEPQSCLIKAVGDPNYIPKKRPKRDLFGKNDFNRIMNTLPSSIKKTLDARRNHYLGIH